MLAYIEGTIIYHSSNYIILKTKEGIGYKVFIMSNTKFPMSNQCQNPNDKNKTIIGNCKLPALSLSNGEIGNSAKLFLYHYIKEDRQELYGFKSTEELEIFETLISISGVGPKTALLVITQYTAGEIRRAIEQDNIAFFQSVKGLGKKTAQKIILELKGKIINIGEQLGPGSQEVLEALVGLGYHRQDILKLITQIPDQHQSSEEKIRWVLKNMGK